MMVHTIRTLALLASLLSATLTMALDPEIPALSVPLAHSAPTIDGVIDDAEWAGAARVEGFMVKGVQMGNREAAFWVGNDGQHLTLAVRTELPPTGSLVARVKPAGVNDRPAYRDDSLELWIDPHKGRTEGDRRFFQIIVNSVGAVYDVAFDPANKQQRAHTNWRIEWDVASTLHDGWWDFECSIPFASIGATPEDLKHPWGLRIGRNWQRPGPQSSWEPRSYAFDDQPSMPVVNWVNSGVLVQQTRLRNPEDGSAQVDLALSNTADTAKGVRVKLYQQSASSPPRTVEETITVKPGAVVTVGVADRTVGAGKAETRIDLRDAETDGILFLRSFTWDRERPETRWQVTADESAAVLLDIGYYPYLSKLKARLDFSALESREKVAGAALVVKAKATGNVLARGTFPAHRDSLSELVLDLPDVPDGEYVVEAALTGAGVPQEPVAREFRREHYEWEHNNLGKTDKVVAPFTPLTVSGNTLGCVLREHVISDLGIWDQVRSMGVDLLAGPMVLRATVDGAETPIRPASDLRFTRRTETEVDYRASWSAGALKAVTMATCEMDGLTKLTMDLTADAETNVEGLDLVIPLKSSETSLMHVCTDGLRFNYAGALPDGTGTLWESKSASRNLLAGTFVPYIWLGGEQRGLAWFADSDRGWLVDDSVSTHEVRCDGNVTELIVHFVTRPGPLRGTHRIVFGLQASPTKPMPTAPVHWRKWMFGSNCDGRAFSIRFLGSCYYWGSSGPCYEVYPRDKAFYLYDVFANIRRTGELSQADEETVTTFLKGYGKDYGKGERYYNHIYWTVRAMQGKPDAVVPYTNARGAGGPEFEVFQDEWHRAAYTARKARPVAYDVTPVESFRDFCVWYFNKMLESGMADGIYFDDIFLQANSDIVSGGAYYDDAGQLRPAADLFAMREYLKRVQILCCRKGIPWVNMSHMTNTQILPINTWVGVNMDWEWKYGKNDFQERFTRDFIRTETLGLQSGCRPSQLDGIKGVEWRSPEQEWLERTQFAINIVHEVQTVSATAVSNAAMALLYDFGYGEPDCTVYQYWCDGFPAQLRGVDGAALVLSRSGAALVVVSDFGEGGEAVVTLDRKALKLAAAGAFTDAESGAGITTAGDAACTFGIRKHDFRIIRYAP